MKFIILFSSILISSFVYSQDSYVSLNNGRYQASKVINYPDISIDKAYENTLLWFGESFKNSEEVITSKTSNAITGRYIDNYSLMGSSITFYHSIKIYFKDDRMKVIIDDIINTDGTQTLSDYCLKKNGKIRGLYKQLYIHFDNISFTIINELEDSLTGSKHMQGW